LNEANKGLQLPGEASARLNELVASWRSENPEPKQLVARALRYFREEPFFYTLDPPLTTGDPTDSFIFETRRGFCEHYAAAFVVLMRLGNVPARVVTGYQGGQWNSVGGFLEVSQSDAHAWAEVWLPESGWTRIDPTAAVAPQRIERGLDLATQLAGGDIRFNLGERSDGKGLALASIWRRARMIGASIDHAWDSWVLAYGQENQGHLLQWLSQLDWRSIAVWLGMGLALAAGVGVLLVLPKRRANADPAKRIYGQFLEKLARGGLTQQTGEGPRAFAERIARAAPELAESAARITRLYLRIRYERSHAPDDLEKMRRLVATLPRRAGPSSGQPTGDNPITR
jgi:hypothetical protein